MVVNLRKPVCFVLMPFGVKIHPDSGASVDFDAIYERTVRPALHNAGMDPFRMDQDFAGLTEGPLRGRVIGAEFVVADVTTREPAILVLLGARAERLPGSTLVLAARGSESQIAGVSAIRVVVYDLDEGNRLSIGESMRLRKTLSAALAEMSDSKPPVAVSRGLASSFDSERSARVVAIAQEIEAARDQRDQPRLQKLESELVHMDPNSALLLNVFQAYGQLGAWESMVQLFNLLPPEMHRLLRVRQQAGLALNRMGRREEAVALLSGLLSEFGPDSETCGLMGRVYKDLWFETKEPDALDHAIEFYTQGFEANRKDPYPGINAVTLLELRGDDASQQAKERLLPLVMAAVQDQLKYSRRPNYWDYATLLEMAVLSGDEKQARDSVYSAQKSNPESWQLEATANNLDLIRDARARRGEHQPWLDQIVRELHTPVPA